MAGDAVTVVFVVDVEETDVAFKNVSIDSDNFVVEDEGRGIVEEVCDEVVVNVVLEGDVFGRGVVLELNKVDVVVVVIAKVVVEIVEVVTVEVVVLAVVVDEVVVFIDVDVFKSEKLIVTALVVVEVEVVEEVVVDKGVEVVLVILVIVAETLYVVDTFVASGVSEDEFSAFFSASHNPKVKRKGIMKIVFAF